MLLQNSTSANELNQFDNFNQSQLELTDSGILSEVVDNKKPILTLPALSIIFDATAITALIGRVPIGDNVTSPMPVKLVLNREAIAANNFNVSGIEGIIFGGTAIGDWGLSCVRVSIDKLSYIHSDGSIIDVEDTGFAYVSSDTGVPCIKGRKISNIIPRLATTGILSTVAGIADAAATAQITNFTSSIGNQQAVTGDAAKYAGLSGIADGVNAASEEFLNRSSDVFDAIYVPPGRNLIVHIEKTIELLWSEDLPKLHSVSNSSYYELD